MGAKNKEIALSFCIAIYNTKAWLNECIASIYQQNVPGFEIICIDDASTDGSYEEIMAISEGHPEIKVFRNEMNMGVSYSRNQAVCRSSGNFIWFVDSDDYLAPQAALLYLKTALMTDAEAVFGRVIAFTDGKKPAVPNNPNDYHSVSFSDPDSFYQRDQAGNYCFGVWLGIFSRDFLLREKICFHEEMRILEDVRFFLETGIKARRIVNINHFGYFYRIRECSLSHGSTDIIARRYYDNSRYILRFCRDNMKTCPPGYRKAVCLHLIRYTQFTIYWLALMTDSAYIREELKSLKHEKYYPYIHVPSEVFTRGQDGITEILFRIFPFEPGFWLVHFAYMAVRLFPVKR